MIPNIKPLLLVTFVLLSGTAQADRDLDTGHGVTVEQILNQTKIAIALLLDPKTPVRVVAELDYGIDPGPYTLQGARDRKESKLAEDLMPIDVNTFVEPGQPIEVRSPTLRPASYLSYFKGHFFSNEYYKRNHEANGKQTPWKDLIDQQPWLEWDETRKTYQVHETGGPQKLIQLISSEPIVTLYRGTFNEEAEFAELIRDSIKNGAAIAKLKAFQKKVTESSNLGRAISEVLSQAPMDGAATAKKLVAAYALDVNGAVGNGAQFAASQLSSARIFTKGVIVTYKIPRSVLLGLANRYALYVGVEFGLEFAFIGAEGILQLFSHIDSVTPHKQDSNIWPDREKPHPLWKSCGTQLGQTVAP